MLPIWWSSHETVAVVEAVDTNTGKVTAISAGTTTISATTSTGDVATCVVTVLENGVEKALYQLSAQYNMVFLPTTEELNPQSIQVALSDISDCNGVDVVVVSMDTDNLTAVIYFKDVNEEDANFQGEEVTIALATELTPEYVLNTLLWFK